jgi:hypothetical protein
MSVEQLDQVADLVRSSQSPEVTAAILGDTEWPRVAGQMHRVLPKAQAAGVDLRQVLRDVAGDLSRCTDPDTHTPAGWMISVLHDATASRGVQLIAQARSEPGTRQTAPRRPGATRPAATRSTPQRHQNRPPAER